MSQKAVVSECQRVFKVNSRKSKKFRTEAHQSAKNADEKRREAHRRQRQAKKKNRK